MCVFLHLTLIWNERFGPDSHNHTLVNLLMSGLSWTTIEYLMLVTSTDLYRYFHGPMTHNFCLVKTMFNLALVTQMLLFITSILLAKYVFIFCLKNPLALNHHYWRSFLTIWIRTFAYLTHGVFYFLPGIIRLL